MEDLPPSFDLECRCTYCRTQVVQDGLEITESHAPDCPYTERAKMLAAWKEAKQ